ncbi:hypothetical protein [Actinoplanes sp. ATCC 53533]|uniref:hypothetical protein n=1 Tax=Actinoplanes sp. ATCC 53533 TaxID=1288362 RepID=UPI000F7A3D79|nr:hypothetical protein [Actinoplanes sp. ATCC 53533]
MSATIVNGEAIHVAGALPGETKRGRGASNARKTKTALLVRKRLMQRSPSSSGLAMSRRESAAAVNAHLYATSGRTVTPNTPTVAAGARIYSLAQRRAR